MRGKTISVVLAIMVGPILAGGCAGPEPDPTVDPEISRVAATARRAFEQGSVEQAALLYARARGRARELDNTAEIANTSYNLALCYTAQGRYAAARNTLREARAEFARQGSEPAEAPLLEAKIAYLENRVDDARAALDRLEESRIDLSEEDRMAISILKAEIALQQEDLPRVREELETAEALEAEETEQLLRAEAAGVAGTLALREDDHRAAAAAFDRQAALLQLGGNYREMARALGRAARAWEKADRPGRAGDRFFRAARSLFAQGDPTAALRMIEAALPPAEKSGDETLRQLIADLFAEIEQSVTPAPESSH